MTELVVRVVGHTPAPQGSFFARIVGKGRAARAIVVSDNDATGPWRKEVAAAARNAITATGWVIVAEPVAVEITFWLPRPASVRREWPSVRPDLDKLARSTLDAITEARGGTAQKAAEHAPVLTDDSLVVDLVVRKRYADNRPAGVTIAVATKTAVLL